MNLIKNKFKETGLKKLKIQETLSISSKTLYNWFNYKNINSIVLFIKLLISLNISNEEFIKDYNKKKKI